MDRATCQVLSGVLAWVPWNQEQIMSPCFKTKLNKTELYLVVFEELVADLSRTVVFEYVGYEV